MRTSSLIVATDHMSGTKSTSPASCAPAAHASLADGKVAYSQQGTLMTMGRCDGPAVTWSHAASVSFSQGHGAERVASSGCNVEYVASDGA